jgi:hypothetical protein
MSDQSITMGETGSIRAKKVVQFGYWSGLAAFVTWFGMGLESVLRPLQDNRRESFWPLPFLLTMVAFICMHLVQRGRSRTEWVGFLILMIASAAMLVGNVGLQLNIHALDWLEAPLGPVIWLVGLTAFGIGILVAGVMPKYAGWAVILLEPASVLSAFALSPIAPLLPRGAYSGNMGKGLAVLAVAIGFQRLGRKLETVQGSPNNAPA